MGLRPAVLCLLASLVLFTAALKDCDHNGKTYKHGEIMNMRCEICECFDGGRRFCERKEACDSMSRRSLSEDAQKLNYLDDPGVIESSFNRKKRSMSPLVEEEFIDNIKAGRSSVGMKGVVSINKKGSEVITGTNQSIKIVKEVKTIKVEQSHVTESVKNVDQSIREELLRAGAHRDMSVKIQIDKQGSHGGEEAQVKSLMNLHLQKGGSDELHKSLGKPVSHDQGKSLGESDSHEDGSHKQGKSQGKPGSHGKSDSHEDGSHEQGKSNVKSGSHGKSGSHEDGSHKQGKSQGKPASHGEYSSEDTDGCLFNHISMAHSETTSLRCLECTCNHGAVSCVRDFQCSGICSVSSFQVIRTFDGSLYDSPGTCSYMLVKTSDFAIYLHNMQCEENEEAVCIQSVEVHITPGLKVKLLSDGGAVSDSGIVDLPHHINDLITIRRSSSVFMEVVSTLGFAIHYDFKGHRVYVIMDTSNKNSTKGLCGTFNDNRNDDFMCSHGLLENVPELFSSTWKIDQSCSEVPRNEVNLDRMVAAKDACHGYLEDSVFADCRTIIDITNYKVSCSASIYYGEDLGGMCSALADYSYHCGFTGITVPFRSSFPDCELNCEDPVIPATLTEFSNRDCREYADQLIVFPAASMLNEMCVCPSDQYYDSNLDTCVDGDQCPCYANNRVYKLGEMVKFTNGKECGCQRIMECSDENIPTPSDPIHCPEGEVYSDCSNGVGKSCEKSCLNLEMIDQTCPTECVPGCACQYGTYRDDEDECVPLSDCNCIHGDDKYNPGETMVKDCSTCTCKDGHFECDQKACPSICNAYGESQFILFDQVWKKFPTADCTMILVMSEQNPAFAVTATSVASRQLAGSFSTKNITIVFGETYVLLTEFGPQVMYNPTASHRSEVNFFRAGFYTVADFAEGLTVYYDLHLDVVIQLHPQLQGSVEGMCGDADGRTTYEFSTGNMLQYGSQFLAAGCPNERPTLPPPSGTNTMYLEERCSILKTDVFFQCHSVVSVDSYYAACVEESASCREGESCLCFCTAVAAYGRACCRSGISVDWRTADTCPAPCEYYNREAGEGPYHLTNMNQLRVVADFDSGTAILSPDDGEEDLKASFMITPGLFKDEHSKRPPISLESTLYPNYFIVQDEDGSVHLDKWQSSVTFRKRATFIWRKNRWMRGYDALESFSQRGYYLTAGSDNSLSVTKYIKSSTQTASFKLTMESFGLPFFSLCLWRYKVCEPPCIKTCQDPYGTKCSLTLNVEGCFPHCTEGLVFDEETHRCVQYEHCVNEPTPEPNPLPPPIPVIPTTPPDECEDATCFLPTCKVGAIPHKVQPRTDLCCDVYICECSACPEPTACGLGLIAVPQFEPEQECCPMYICEPIPMKPGTTTTPPKTTTIHKCDGVTCHVPMCSRTGETLVPAPSDDPCCPAYTCGCLPCPSPLTCNLGYILNTTTDDDINCCPSHICVCPTCPGPPVCSDGSILRTMTNQERPCCSEYKCEPLLNPETTTIANPETTTIAVLCTESCTLPNCTKTGAFMMQSQGGGGDVCCPKLECVCPPCPPPIDCGLGFREEIHFNEITDCCSSTSCHHVVETTPSSPTTTRPAGCEGVTCLTKTCERDGEVLVTDPSDHSCCPRSICDCLPCPPQIDCGPGVQPNIFIDIDKSCCPKQTCPHGSVQRTTPAATTPMYPCAHVICPTSSCGKIGAVPVVSANPCCNVCECQDCVPAQVCGFGLIAVPDFDSTKECCPTYKCACTTTCTPAVDCEPGYTQTSHYTSADSCCPVYDCVLSTTTPRSVTTPQTPRSITTSQTPRSVTTPQDVCKDVTCAAVPACTRTDELPETHGSVTDCCPNVICVCQTCAPALECGLGLTAVEAFNSDIECCPRYTCECLRTCPPPEPCTEGLFLIRVQNGSVCCPEFECVSLIRKLPIPPAPAPDTCQLVTCVAPGCNKTGELPHQIDEGSGMGSGEDLCCPEYICECPPECPPPQVCGSGFDTEESFNVNLDCCPGYRCVPQPPPSPKTTPYHTPKTTPYHNPCDGVTCADAPQCIKFGSVLDQVESSGEDTCCPEYECVCESCASVLTCPTPNKLKTYFESNVECCPRYECESPCVGITCAPPPGCTKIGEIAVHQEDSNAEACCPEYHCVCQECQPAPLCEPGWKSKEVVKSQECCVGYTCEPPCFGVTCAEPPQCPKEGQISVSQESSGEDECCPEYDCECKTCPPVPDCADPNQRIELFSPAEECCPQYICEPSPCENVICSSPPQCTKQGETAVPQGRTEDDCCRVYECECVPCLPGPICPQGSHSMETFNTEVECCPRYKCQSPCFGVTCLPPPKCLKKGETAVHQEGSGQDHCCPDYECQCEFCPLPPKCDPGFQRERKFDENTECCPTYVCVPPCYGVTCDPAPNCTKTGESVVRQEGSGHDSCCPDEECECGDCILTSHCPDGHHRVTFFNPEIECCERYTCELLPTTAPETMTTPPTTTPDHCKGVTCSDPPQCQKSRERVVSHFGVNQCCLTYVCECPDCGPPLECPAESQSLQLFDPDTECCPNYICVPPCFGVTCDPPPICPKSGQAAVWTEGSGEDECCQEYECECEPCSAKPVCSPGLKLNIIFNEEDECCPYYTCEPLCTGITCAPPPECTRTGEVPFEIPMEGSGDDDQECCTDYFCECEICGPPPKCDAGFYRQIWIDPEVECCPHYRCVCELCAPPPTCEDGYRREVVPGPENVCCSRYICMLVPTTTPEPPLPAPPPGTHLHPGTPPPTTPGVCEGVICPSPPQCKRFDEVPVEHWEGSGQKECCPQYKCECLHDCSIPQCGPEFTLKEFTDKEYFCCPQYKCELPCFGVTCAVPPVCHKIGETAVVVEGSGQDDQCCDEYKCECHNCAPKPNCDAGLTIKMSFNPETECCPHYTCEPLCLAVTCAEPPKCGKIGETRVVQEGSGIDPCCSEYKCVCSACPPPPDCGPGYVVEPTGDSPQPRCCPQYNCKLIPTPPAATPPPTTPFCADVTCRDITCKSNERLVEKPKPPQACCAVFVCEPIPTAPGTTVYPPIAPELCNHVTCTVKACKPYEKLVQRPTPPQACCPIYDCECQCDSVPTCGSDERLVPVHQVNQCCPRLKCEKKKDECDTVPKAVQLIVGQCEATVQLQACSGYCHSSSEYSHLGEPVSHCQCCAVKSTQNKNFEIPCPNGKKTTVLVKEAVACSCQSCSGEENSSSEEQSGNSSEEQSSTLD